MFKKVGIACDHAGIELKAMLFSYLQASGYEPFDLGGPDSSSKSVDYPDFAEIIATALIKSHIDCGIAICGTGIGMCMAANKFPTVRAVTVWDDYTARMSRSHNNANVLCLGARTLNHHRAMDIVNIWLKTPFANDRHELRLNKILAIEKRNFKPV